MKVALVHYWLVNMRGGERVLEMLCKLYPTADIYTHVYAPENISDTINSHRVYTTYINKLPFAKSRYQYYLPFMPSALEQLDLRDYDLIISSESGPAKGVINTHRNTHICYCHTPMRYIWDMYFDYIKSTSPLLRPLMRYFSHKLRLWDFASASRVDHFVANSKNVALRINKHYRRESAVIYPPVAIDDFSNINCKAPIDKNFYLCFGQLVNYKRFDIAIEAFAKMGKELIVIGEGPEINNLKNMATENITFLGRLSLSKILPYINHCEALIFPGEEDFGIIPVEVMAAGKPVIAYAKGGVLETVIHEKTGILFNHQTAKSLIEAVGEFEETKDNFSAKEIAKHAAKFSEESFCENFKSFVDSVI